MKKFLAIIASLALVLGFAASAFAIHAEIPSETQAVVAKGTTQITLGGELRFRGELTKNTDLGANEKNGVLQYGGRYGEDDQNTKSYYDGRVRLRLQADVTKNTMGVVHLESGTNTGDTYKWGSQDAEGKGIYNEGNAKSGTLSILEAWIQHKGSGLLGIPAGVKVGHMPLALGNKLFFDHSKFGDDAIVFFVDPTKELHIGLLTAKFKENTDTSADDSDAYVGLFAYKGQGFNLSGDVTYVDAKRFKATNPRDKGTHLWNYGLRGDVKVSDLTLRGDIELQSGKTKANPATAGTYTYDKDGDGTNDTNNVKWKGYAYLLGLDYKLGATKLTLEHAYGSGSGSGTNSPRDDGKTFVTALSGVQYYTYVYDYRARTATNTNGNANSTGLANTWYVKLGANTDLTKDLNALVNIYYLRASKAVAINGAQNADGTYKTSKNIGTEIDAKFTYKIDKNLVYFVEGGYLFAGSAYDYGQSGSATTPLKGSDDAYAVRHGITLNF